jgi:hypothetical protein
MSSSRSLFHYATVMWVLAQLGSSSAANAAVVVRESSEFFTALANTIGLFPIDFDGNGTDDIALYSDLYAYSSSGAFAIGQGSGIFSLPFQNPEEQGANAAPVRFGQMITTLSEPWSDYGALWGGDYLDPIYGRSGSVFYGTAERGIIGAPPIQGGYWRPGDRLACGVRFLGDDGLYRYGWVDVEMNWVTALTIHGWGYETDPNTFVTPFQIPEPSVLLLTALPLAELLLRRRRAALGVGFQD